MTLPKKLLPLTVLSTILIGFGVQSASADTLILSIGNSDLSGYTGPFADVTITLTDGTHASIAFAADAPYLLTDGGSVGVNVHATTFTAANFAWSGQPQTPHTTPTLVSGGAGNQDGFGNFNFSINNGGSFQEAVQNISFTLTNTSGTWASAADVLTGNNKGFLAASHIGVQNTGGTAFATTGFAANGTGSTVPDGGTTASLLGLALTAGGVVSRRRK